MNGSAFGRLLKNSAYPDYRYIEENYNEIFKKFHKVYSVGKKVTVTPKGTFRLILLTSNTLNHKKCNVNTALNQCLNGS